MALSQIITAVEAELAALNAYVTTIAVGDEFVAENDARPRIIVIPDEDEFAAPTGVGGLLRAIKDVAMSAELILRGPSYDVVESLRDQFVVALHRAIKGDAASSHGRGGTYLLGKGKWTRGTNIARNGQEWSGSFSVMVPVVERTWPASADPPVPPDASTTTYDLAPPDTEAVSDVAAELGDPSTPQGNATVSTA